ncbi:hypothetical protein AOL_s00173g290 [Orbilia oligospora ATCC 24927]|uniref:Uncharacterized protein n=1 Tax=Arthrobotrys oligospora (strain ATCC 24927 / CBS 115.81 / DSM 1491) TaxID=756982 RepID=G1XPC2_ARTOA|nr:hypothetical protein AOL_s00173g290 [Orbilia oligospora ATCC 24927]EGX45189.1 hypothetical protein AOL_s00173g290 [Orbilia oligospora ATCC 24927]
MQILNSAVALAVLSLVSPISGHVAIIGARGDQERAVNGQAFGITSQTHVLYDGKLVGFRSGDARWPFQKDTTVFASPAVPWKLPGCWLDKKGKKVCHKEKYLVPVRRKYFDGGCGVTLHTVGQYAKYRDALWNTEKAVHRTAKFFQQPVKPGAMVNVSLELTHSIKIDKLTTAAAGGFIKMTMHEVNKTVVEGSGGGFRCFVDSTGLGRTFPTRLKLTPGALPAGVKPNKEGTKQWHMMVYLPTSLDCKGSHNGRKSICIIRCQDRSEDGPFGGCVPFQQLRPGDKDYSPPKPQPTNIPEPEPAPIQSAQTPKPTPSNTPSKSTTSLPQETEVVDYGDEGSDYSDEPEPYDSYY